MCSSLCQTNKTVIYTFWWLPEKPPRAYRAGRRAINLTTVIHESRLGFIILHTHIYLQRVFCHCDIYQNDLLYGQFGSNITPPHTGLCNV